MSNVEAGATGASAVGRVVGTEDAIWNAVRTLQEEAMLLQHLARHAQDAGQEEEVRSLEEAARQKLQLAGDIRQTVTRPAEGAHEPVAR